MKFKTIFLSIFKQFYINCNLKLLLSCCFISYYIFSFIMTFDNSSSATTIRKFLKNIINLTINVVHSFSTLEDVNKNDYVKKFNANRFKKDSAHSRSKSINFTDHLIRLKKTFYAKTIQRREEIVTWHNQHAKRRAQVNDSPLTFFSFTSFILRCYTLSLIDLFFHFVSTSFASFERRKRQKRLRLRYRCCDRCVVFRALIQFVENEKKCKYCTENVVENEMKLQ